jgi:LAO/AO transport system kinase
MQFAIEEMLDQKEQVTRKLQWRPPVLRTSADRGDGVSNLYENIIKHYEYLNHSDVLKQRRELQYKSEIIRGIHKEVMNILKESGIDDEFFSDLSRTMKKRNTLPHNVAKTLARKIFHGGLKHFEEKKNFIDSLVSPTEEEQ